MERRRKLLLLATGLALLAIVLMIPAVVAGEWLVVISLLFAVVGLGFTLTALRRDPLHGD